VAGIINYIKNGAAAFAAWWGKRRLGARITIIALLSLTALVMLGVITVRLWMREPPEREIILHTPSRADLLPPRGIPSESRPADGEEEEELGYDRREGVFTFLLAGVNEGMADTVMVATLDTVANTCHVLSIPRDTAIENAPRSIRKISGAYNQQRNVEEPGMAQLRKEIASLIGYQPQYGAIVNYRAFVRLVNAIGGVEFHVPMRMYVPAEGIDLYAGRQALNGNQALQMVRFRYDPVTGHGYDDYGRMRVQQQFLAAAAKQALSNWHRFPEYIDIARENLQSDVDWGNLLWFAEEVRKIGIDNVVFNTLPTSTVINPAEIGGGFYEAVLSEEALELINETINPFIIPIGPELVEHMILTERR
jgi:LCP family protein required for cell wall assembly